MLGFVIGTISLIALIAVLKKGRRYAWAHAGRGGCAGKYQKETDYDEIELNGELLDDFVGGEL